jgi:type IV fimbrial biogenesis protein FimT
MNTRRTMPRLQRQQAGVTLVETAAVTAVVAAITSVAIPSFEQALDRRHLEGAAAQLETDIHYARSLAVARNRPLRISFDNTDGASCYVIHTGSAQQCSCAADGSAVCQGDATAERSVRYAADSAVSLKSNSRSVLFDPVRGTSTPTATVQLKAGSGMAIHQVLNVMGRVRSCSPAPALSGYARC